MDAALLTGAIRTMTVILGGLIIGYGLRKSGRVGDSVAGPVNRTTLTYIQPVVICLALWIMKRPAPHTLALPVFGVALVVAMWGVGVALARVLRMERDHAGAFIISCMFSNVGFTYGTFVAFAALGAEGAALGSLYCASFMPTVFTLGFYVGKRYSPGTHESVWQALRGLLADGQTRNPVLGIAAGLALNLLRVPAPAELPFAIDILMPTTTAAFLLAIGLGLRLSAVRVYWRECAVLHAAKFVISPAIGLLLAAAFGYWGAQDRAPLIVALIESATPTAVMAVMLADVFSLNRGLAGALWLTTNVTAVLLAPVILVLVKML